MIFFSIMQNVTEPDFRENIFWAENAGNMPEKPVFWHFLEISSLVFSDILHIDAYQYCRKCVKNRFLKKIFFRPIEPGICRKSPFFGFPWHFFNLTWFFLYRKRFLMVMFEMWQSLISNKIIFCNRNSLKIAGTAENRRKTVFLHFLKLYSTDFHDFLHNDSKW